MSSPTADAAAPSASQNAAPTDNTIWLLGLPIDVRSLSGACSAIAEATHGTTPLVFATANLNFLRTAHEDPAFAHTIRKCDLVLADGTPILWLASAMGTPLPERVAGSSIVEHLMASNLTPPLRTCFAGGPPGVAARASERISASPTGLRGVGAVELGFGTVDELSDPATISEMNATHADFLIVSLGARKGHLWIEHNRTALSATVISHLGAVVNFVAGTVRRAPPAWQHLGVEWVWRTLQEPSLAGRYARDAAFLLRETLFAVVPILAWRAARGLRTRRTRLELAGDPSGAVVLDGPIVTSTRHLIDSLRHDILSGLRPASGSIDLRRVTDVDAAGLGALHVLRKAAPAWAITNPSRVALFLIRRHRAQSLLSDRYGTEPVCD